MKIDSMTRAVDDESLVKAARSGSRVAFDELVRRHARSAGRLATRLVGNREDSEDIVQESFTKAFQHLDAFQGRCSFRSWVLHITMHQAKDLIRRRGRSRQFIAPSSDEPAAPTVEPGSRADAKAQIDTLTAALADLPPRQKTALFLKVYEGMSYPDVAAALGTSVAATRVYLWMARQSLRRRFERFLGPEDAS